ncbi:MAG: energy-coupling factor transporter ATPase [Clostridiales bacterium]|nr:energy-coupling factor transporter ATPase [Clostridiales bacterium]
MSSEPIIRTENLTHLYSEGLSSEVAAIHNINIEIMQGEILAIIGHTGSGKSTLIQHFNGLLKPSTGRVFVDGKDIWESKQATRESRFKVGLCFQYPEYQLFEESVYKDIAFGPKNMGLDENETGIRVRRAAAFVGVDDDMLERSPFDLSGGEKRRVAIAGVMAMEPKVLVLDEPTSGLDPRGRDMVLDLIGNYRRQTGNTVILVSHSMEDVARLATKVLVMNDSQIAMCGSVEQVYSQGTLLYEMGLNVPQITRIFMGLRSHGIDVNDGVFTVEQGRNEIARLLKSRGVQK